MFWKKKTYVGGRRRDSRLRAELAATLETRMGTLPLVISDLSPSGARLRSPVELQPGRKDVLRWRSYEMRGKIVWQDGELVGLAFRKPLDAAVIAATYGG